MVERSLNGYINQKLTYLFIVMLIIVILFVFFLVEGFIKNITFTYMDDLTVDLVFSSLEQFDDTLSSLERTYDTILTSIIYDFDDKLKLVDLPLDQLTNKQLDLILDEIIEEHVAEFNIVGTSKNNYNNIYYYIIDENGIIIESNDSKQISQKLTNYEQIASSLKDKVLIERLSNEGYERNIRKYGYIRYLDRYIIKFGLPLGINIFDKIANRFKSLEDKFSFVKEIAIYRDVKTPINELFGHPTAEDTNIFKGLSPVNSSIKKAVGRYSFIYYTIWNNDLSSNYINITPYYIKLKMDYSDNILTISRTMTLFVCTILFLVMFSIFLINRRLSSKIVTPFVYLAENMSKLGNNDLSSIDENLERTDIREVNMLLSSYQEMTSELAGSFQELKAVNEELEDSYKETSVLAENLHNVIHVATKLTDSVFDDKERFLIELFYVAKKLIPEADYGTVFVVEDNKIKWLESVGHNLEAIKAVHIDIGFYNTLDEVVYVKDINEIDEEQQCASLKKELLTAKKPINSSLTVQLFVGGELAGALNYDIDKSSKDQFSKQSIETIKAFGNLASAFLTMQSYKYIHERFQREIILSIINMLEIHDSYTKGHSENVARISALLAAEMGYSSVEVRHIEWAGLVHDIGKILISKKILNKKGVLTADEYTQIKKHTIWGYEVLANSEELSEIAIYVRHHHERWDGAGYPDGLEGEEIPRISRIIGLADSWDTMRSDRIYRSKLPREVAIEELKVNRGRQFDPEVVDVALRLIEEGKLK